MRFSYIFIVVSNGASFDIGLAWGKINSFFSQVLASTTKQHNPDTILNRVAYGGVTPTIFFGDIQRETHVSNCQRETRLPSL